MGTSRTILIGVTGALCLAGAVLALADVQTPARLILTPMFLLVAPGAAIAGLLRDRDPLSALTVGLAASLAVNVLLAEAMLLLDAWSPRAGVATVAVVSAFLVILRQLHRPRTRVTPAQHSG
ncbi:hypothetical protein [Herbidospora mongoliensis]|uniref:hypothetical protein n=1 Tax=Herbidospora mongoliensis TaxID=688067 RepID=UPI0008357F88|nr:hypothetical protein [Herbidospora mongoliensis]